MEASEDEKLVFLNNEGGAVLELSVRCPKCKKILVMGMRIQEDRKFWNMRWEALKKSAERVLFEGLHQCFTNATRPTKEKKT